MLKNKVEKISQTNANQNKASSAILPEKMYFQVKNILFEIKK